VSVVVEVEVSVMESDVDEVLGDGIEEASLDETTVDESVDG
jgi:hypothetical protein